jgi:hypothetical protein
MRSGMEEYAQESVRMCVWWLGSKSWEQCKMALKKNQTRPHDGGLQNSNLLALGIGIIPIDAVLERFKEESEATW